MSQSAVPSHRRSRALWLVGLLVVVGIAVWLVLRSCHPVAPATKQLPFDYFRVKATELHNDPAQILAYVRDTMPTLDYRGDVKGALGALWNGAASVDEKKALAEALLAAAGSGRSVTLDEVAPGRDKTKDAVSPIHLSIVHRVETSAGKPQDTPLYDGPAGTLVGDVHSVEMLANGQRRITLRNASQAPREITVSADAQGEDLVFTWHIPGEPKSVAPRTSVRELWHRGNPTGPQRAQEGDRHDFVVIPCRVDGYVREKEELILTQRGRDHAPEASPYLSLLDYAMQSDEELAELEKQEHVTALRNEPRVLILSQVAAAELPGGKAQALDLRINAVDFTGERAAAYRATQVRSFLESAQAEQFVEKITGLPAEGTFSVFTMLKDDDLGSAPRRVARIRAALSSLAQERSDANTATFSVRTEAKPPGATPSVTARWTPSGFEIRGGPLRKDVVDNLAKTRATSTLPSAAPAVTKDIDDATAMVEIGLLAADVSPPISPRYALAISLDRKNISLVQPQARFRLKWQEDGHETDQLNRVLSVGEGLEYQWRIQVGVLPVAGTRQVLPEALADSAVHNPWYKTGSSQQDGATSFVFSRKVYRAIQSGQPIELTMEGRRDAKADDAATRPVEFHAPLTPVKPGVISPTVNGRSEKLGVLECTLRGKPIAILDDSAYPVGLATQIESIVTVVRGRVVDAQGTPIAGALVQIVDKAQPTEMLATAAEPTAPDGLFELPPPIDGDSYGKVTLDVMFSDKSHQKVAADLTNPGLSIITVKAERPRPKLLYLGPADRRQLEALPLSESVKRQARRDFDTGQTVVIPAGNLNDGLHDRIAYYACNNDTGEYVGVTEDGLCGACNWADLEMAGGNDAAPMTNVALTESDVAATQATQPATATDSMASAPDDARAAYRRALNLWHACSEGQAKSTETRELSQRTLDAMKSWGQVTDLAGTYAALPEAQLATKLSELLKTGRLHLGGAIAKPAIQLGYVEASGYLARKVEGDHGN